MERCYQFISPKDGAEELGQEDHKVLKKKKKKDWGRGADISATEFQKVIIFSPNLLAHWFQQPLM